MSVVDISIAQIEEITANLIQRIHLVDYEELANFAEQRELLVHSIIQNQELVSDGHRQRILALKSYDEIILSKMEDYKIEASKWLSKQGSIREQKNAYSATYSLDSYFVDHKK
jgi:hypothetical protein